MGLAGRHAAVLQAPCGEGVERGAGHGLDHLPELVDLGAGGGVEREGDGG